MSSVSVLTSAQITLYWSSRPTPVRLHTVFQGGNILTTNGTDGGDIRKGMGPGRT